MPGTILENLNSHKLSVLVSILLVCQIFSFLIGLMAPWPATKEYALTTVCLDLQPDLPKKDRWFTKDCNSSLPNLNFGYIQHGYNLNDVVFVAEIPLNGLQFYRWEQNLISVLNIDINYKRDQYIPNQTVELVIDAQLAYSNNVDNNHTAWTYYAHAEQKYIIDYKIETDFFKSVSYPPKYTMVPIFELGSLFHDYYLLNLRLPQNYTAQKNMLIEKVVSINMFTINIHGGFTRIWLVLKAVCFFIILSVMFWFWKRLHLLSRSLVLLEYMLLLLGGAVAILDVPIEYLTLFFNIPCMFLLNDIRQAIFFIVLFSFWLVFAAEHMLIQDNAHDNKLKKYWVYFSPILIACLPLLLFNISQRIMQLTNPFFFFGSTPIYSNLELSFKILAGISACICFVFLCYILYIVFKNIRIKRSALVIKSEESFKQFGIIIFRFNFLILWTIICAAITVISFILTLMTSNRDLNLDLELPRTLYTSVYGMWNLYICSLLLLYAPSYDSIATEKS